MKTQYVLNKAFENRGLELKKLSTEVDRYLKLVDTIVENEVKKYLKEAEEKGFKNELAEQYVAYKLCSLNDRLISDYKIEEVY